MTKPKLSFWQIWNLSFGFLGVQIGYSLQNSNTSSIFESLGADVSHLSYFWLAAPLAGMIVQPIVGLFSDGTWTRWGRRIPYILGGSLISALALVLMPNCPKLLAFAPLAMGAFILLFMDLSFCSWICRSTSRCSLSGRWWPTCSTIRKRRRATWYKPS